jgi:hypothetical protein
MEKDEDLVGDIDISRWFSSWTNNFLLSVDVLRLASSVLSHGSYNTM